MQILGTGISNKSNRFGIKGLTLIELLVVVFLLSNIIIIATPRMHLLTDSALNSEARRIAGLLQYIQEAAATKKLYYKILFYPEKEEIQIESSYDGVKFEKSKEPSLKGFILTDGIDMEDIIMADLGKITEGEIAILFAPSIGPELFNIHLKTKEKTITLIYNSYSGSVKIVEGYV